MDRDEVMVVRTELCDRLKKAAVLDSDDPALEWVIATGEKSNSAATSPFTPALARDNPALNRVIYDGAMMCFYELFLGGTVRHHDYTWFRAKQPGTNTATTPHCGIVYMGQGTTELDTSWTSFGDVPYEMGRLDGARRLAIGYRVKDGIRADQCRYVLRERKPRGRGYHRYDSARGPRVDR